MRGSLLPYAILLSASLTTSACFYPAPIDEDPEAEDVMPQIDQLSGVSPGMGLVSVNLANGGRQQFFVSGYSDLNKNQELFHRIVIDYRSAGVNSNPISATIPRTIMPDARDPLSYEFVACQASQSYPDAIKEGKVIALYVLLSDEQYMHFNQLFAAVNFSHPFETRTGRGSVWVSWNVQFVGVCP